MDGTLDIQRLSDALSTIERYQIRYEDVIGESFSASMNREELHDLLYRKLALGMSNEELDRSVEILFRDGRIIFPEIVMKPNELAGCGLKYLEVEG